MYLNILVNIVIVSLYNIKNTNTAVQNQQAADSTFIYLKITIT